MIPSLHRSHEASPPSFLPKLPHLRLLLHFRPRFPAAPPTELIHSVRSTSEAGVDREASTYRNPKRLLQPRLSINASGRPPSPPSFVGHRTNRVNKPVSPSPKLTAPRPQRQPQEARDQTLPLQCCLSPSTEELLRCPPPPALHVSVSSQQRPKPLPSLTLLVTLPASPSTLLPSIQPRHTTARLQNSSGSVASPRGRKLSPHERHFGPFEDRISGPSSAHELSPTAQQFPFLYSAQ